MSMPIKAVDRLFDRLGLTYGSAWLRKWDGMPINEVKSLWSHELAYYANHLDAVAWALENLPENCPNVVEFRNLCRKAPEVQKPRLPEPKANPERLAAELSKLMQIKKKVLSAPAEATDGRDWARRIIARQVAGEKIVATSLRFAKEALS